MAISKYAFIKTLLKDGFNFVSRSRDDAVLFHILNQAMTSKRGKPKTKAERVDFEELSVFDLIKQTDTKRIYTAIIKYKALKINIRIVVYATYLKLGVSKIFFSTQTYSKINNISKNVFNTLLMLHKQ